MLKIWLGARFSEEAPSEEALNIPKPLGLNGGGLSPAAGVGIGFALLCHPGDAGESVFRLRVRRGLTGGVGPLVGEALGGERGDSLTVTVDMLCCSSP